MVVTSSIGRCLLWDNCYVHLIRSVALCWMQPSTLRPYLIYVIFCQRNLTAKSGLLRLHLGVWLLVEHDLLYFFIIVLVCSIVSFGSWIVRHLHLGVRLFVEYDLLCFFTIVILCSIVLIVLFDSRIVHLSYRVPSYLFANSFCCFFFMSYGDHISCWWLAELCVELRFHPCPSPLFSLMGEACTLTFKYPTYFVLNMKFFSYYLGLCFELFQSSSNLIVDIFSAHVVFTLFLA